MLIGRVEMRGHPDAAGARGAHDVMLHEILIQGGIVGSVFSEGNDPGLTVLYGRCDQLKARQGCNFIKEVFTSF